MDLDGLKQNLSKNPLPKKDIVRFTKYFSTEIKVRAIQCRLEERKINNFATTILGHVFWGTTAELLLPFAKFQTLNHLEEWIDNLAKSTYNRWTEDKIEFEFKKRLDYWRDWTETK